MVNYRFFLLGHSNRIFAAHVAQCDSDDSIGETALALLARHDGAAAVEVWLGAKLVLRTERAARAKLIAAGEPRAIG